MTAYLRKLLEERLLRRAERDNGPPPGRSASPVLKKLLAERRKNRIDAAPEAEAPPPPPRIDHLPADSRIVSNGNGKNVYLGSIPAGRDIDVLKLLDDPSLSLEDEQTAFDPYDHSDSWKRLT